MVPVDTAIPRLQLAVPGTPWNQQKITRLAPLWFPGNSVLPVSLHLCPRNRAAGGLQLHATWQPPLQRLGVITVCLSAGVELTCSDCVTVLTTTQFKTRSRVTCCYMHGLSLTVPLKPDKTLSGEINSSGDRGKWLNSWPAHEGFVQL